MTSVKRAGLADAAILARLHAQCFDEAWDESAFVGLLAGERCFALLAGEIAHESQAFILVRVVAGESEILSLGVVPSARRSGLARFLVQAASEEAQKRGGGEMFLEVAADNAAALALYKSVGFRPVGERRGYYHRRGSLIDAAVLRASLPLKA